VREAIDQKEWKLAEQQITVVGHVLEQEAAAIDAAAQTLEQACDPTKLCTVSSQ